MGNFSLRIRSVTLEKEVAGIRDHLRSSDYFVDLVFHCWMAPAASIHNRLANQLAPVLPLAMTDDCTIAWASSSDTLVDDWMPLKERCHGEDRFPPWQFAQRPRKNKNVILGEGRLLETLQGVFSHIFCPMRDPPHIDVT